MKQGTFAWAMDQAGKGNKVSLRNLDGHYYFKLDPESEHVTLFYQCEGFPEERAHVYLPMSEATDWEVR